IDINRAMSITSHLLGGAPTRGTKLRQAGYRPYQGKLAHLLQHPCRLQPAAIPNLAIIRAKANAGYRRRFCIFIEFAQVP
ncbi:MAG: hypothetical protein PUK38_06565, partial [Coriobacteriaceae bacterium]|nr:hypothetical protein [Coriobacteriaceae bacterium]